MNTVFLSHASADQAVTKNIAHALAQVGVNTWASFRDIAPGSRWDESIEAALRSSAALVVVVSRSSVESRYVRAEVEDAISSDKTVVPVIVEDVEIPLRWRTLQHLRWTVDDQQACATAIATILPERAVSALSSALNDSARFSQVRDLVLTHPEWLPMEAYMSKWYSFRVEADITANSKVDCFVARLDTPGPRAILVYLTSPYERPFSASGGARPHMRKTLSTIRLHVDFLRREIPTAHPLAPSVLFAAEAHGWTYILPRYTGLSIHILAGRRSHYEGTTLNARNKFVANANIELYKGHVQLGALEVLSYDRLLESARAREARRSGAYPRLPTLE